MAQKSTCFSKGNFFTSSRLTYANVWFTNTSNFTIAANLGDYRTTHHVWKLNFKRGSITRKSEMNLVPHYTCTFTPPANIWLPTFDANYLVGGHNCVLTNIILLYLISINPNKIYIAHVVPTY